MLTLRGLKLAVSTLAILATGSSCESTGPVAASVATVTLTAPVSTIKATRTLVLTAQALDRNGIPLNDRSFVWNSENTAVATVDQNGLVRGVSPGSAVITASSGGRGGAFTLVVTSASFASITVPLSGTMLVGTAFQAWAFVVDSTGKPLYDAPVKWQSSNPAVVRIDSTGLLGTLAVGTARIDASAEGLTASSQITVLPRPPIRFKSIFAHHFHTCGLSVEGTAYCWGSNASADLGAGRTPPVNRSCSTQIGPCSSAPLAVGGQHIFQSLGDGWYFHTCADDSQGTYCWGNNRTGQIGDGKIGLTQALPARVLAPSVKYSSVSAGGDVTCGLRASQSIDCWGSDEFGQLGDSTSTETCPTSTFNDVPVRCSRLPRRVSASVGFNKLTVGGIHACALTPDGTAYCWGSADYGALGAVATSLCGKVVCNKTPKPVATDLRFTDIGAGFGFTCAISTDSRTYCWGENDQGQLGTGSLSPQETSPVPVKSTSSFVKLSVGAANVCALDSAGNAFCWGNNERGQVGDGSTTHRSTPVQIGQNLRFTSLGVGTYHVCGIATDGYAYCWGNNSMGQVGVGNEVTIMPPTRVSGQ